MRLPDDFEEHNSGMTPTVFSAIISVTVFVGAILVMVLLMNSQSSKKNPHVPQSGTNQTQEAQNSPILGNTGEQVTEPGSLVSGSTLSPDDLDFWDKYPEKKPEPESETETGQKEAEGVVENDPATDGKHTMVVNRDGEEEWILISPYLPKHEYDFTKLVCQSDFMKYYEEGRQVSYTGVDISKHQDYVDFVSLKKAGADFVMLRVGIRGYGSGQLVPDENFSDNIKRATDAGLQVGVYFSSQAVTVEEAEDEAIMVIENIREYKITYPVAFEMGFVENDTSRIETLSKSEKTDIAKAFLDIIADEGYKPILCGDKEWLLKEIDMSKLTAYDVCLTQIQDVPDYPYRFTMWQYKNDASMDGVVGYVKLFMSFVDYSEK